MVEDEIAIKWNSVKPSPEEVLTLMFCTCPRKCVVETCPCIGNGLICTDACTKSDCGKYINEEIINKKNKKEEVEDQDEHSDYESQF